MCAGNCSTCLFINFYKLYYEIRHLWLLKSVKSMHCFKTDNCRELLSFLASRVLIVPFSAWKWSDASVVLAGHLHNAGSLGNITCSPKWSVKIPDLGKEAGGGESSKCFSFSFWVYARRGHRQVYCFHSLPFDHKDLHFNPSQAELQKMYLIW